MAVDRPTFSESWYRVANLRPRLRTSVKVSRQHFRGKPAYILNDPSSNQFSRMPEEGYHFVGLLDGRRTVAEVWRICNDQLGDGAPTQPEVIQLLGQLYTSNLLQAELPPDAAGLFDRYRQRRQREIKGYLTNLLFIRLPLIDPDRFLNRWVGVFGKAFSKWGFLVWLALLSAGIYFVIGRWGELANKASGVLDPDNLFLLYVGFALVKVFHEFGHAFACKQFGRVGGKGGEVHVMGVMFLVFMPLPYVDATSAWEFRRKWHRVIVGAGGILVELAIASVAAIVWANTSEGAVVHKICYNVMFIASVSTVLFNGNPLLRFDAYYILADVLEITNLWQRSREYIYYLVKRYAWGIRQARNPAHTRGEKAWLGFYGVASTFYRFFVVVRILLFVADKLWFIGMVLSLMALAAWVLTPLYKFVRYLATSNELTRKRPRAVASTVLTVAAVVAAVGIIPAPDRFRAPGVVEPERYAVVYAGATGTVRDVLPSHQTVVEGDWLVKADNFELAKDIEERRAERDEFLVRREWALTEGDPTMAEVLDRQLASVDENIAILEKRRSELTATARVSGTWLSPEIENMEGVLVTRGQPLGEVVSLDDMIVRVVVDQEFPVDRVREREVGAVTLRVQGRPDLEFRGTVTKVLPAGMSQLPSKALGYAAGGPVQTSPEDRQGTQTQERFFEIQIQPDLDADGRIQATDGGEPILLRSGQRVVARFSMEDQPLVMQWYRSLRQLVLRRYHV